MKNLKLGLFLLGFILVATSCKNTVKSPSGYMVKFHKKGGGEKAKIGQFVYFDFYVKKDSQMFYASNERGQKARLQIVDPSKFRSQERPIIEALMMMGKGDSVSIVQRIDTFKTPPQGFAGAKLMTYIVVLKDIVSEEKYMADLDPQSRQQFKLEKELELSLIHI